MAKEDVLRKAARVWFHRTVYGPASQGQGPARSARARELDSSCTTSSSSSRSGCQCQTCGVGNPLVPLSPGDTRHNSSIKWSSSPNCASPCSSPFFSDRDRDFTELWLAVWSVLCCLSTLITFSTFLLNTRRFHYPERPIMFLSL